MHVEDPKMMKDREQGVLTSGYWNNFFSWHVLISVNIEFHTALTLQNMNGLLPVLAGNIVWKNKCFEFSFQTFYSTQIITVTDLFIHGSYQDMFSSMRNCQICISSDPWPSFQFCACISGMLSCTEN